VLPANLVVRGDTIYVQPPKAVHLSATPLARPGLPLGRARPGRFVPDHALAATLGGEDATASVELDDADARSYLRGNTVDRPGPDGWALVTWRGWTLGWGRRSGSVLKNHLPDHIRRLAG
jgi:NOL1/NOP2/fmu family ribosome biogenesis protein